MLFDGEIFDVVNDIYLAFGTGEDARSTTALLGSQVLPPTRPW
jgi:hypothetical protein